MRTIKRDEAIRDIRREVLALVEDDHSLCEVAGRLGIFCRGFRQFDDQELFRRYDWIAKRKHVESRPALEVLANRWQLARQFVQNAELACDVQLRDRDGCDGWDTFNNAKLAQFYKELCAEEVDVIDDGEVHYRTFR